MKPFDFALECPKCGSINTASKFIFAKNEIECGVCGETINVKQSRMISKQCPNCGKTFIHDQGKKGELKCPHCGDRFPVYESDTYHYKMVTVHCPQCGCGVEAEEDNKDFACPLCDTHFDVSKVKLKEELVKDNAISVIEYEGDNSTFVWKHPIENFNMGSQLIVHESQEAVVFINGSAYGPYPDGRYTLDSENIPILKNLFDVSTGTNTPFHCEVYFVNKTVHMGMKWGTPGKVNFLEPESGIPLEIGAHGELKLQVSDSRKLLAKLVGTTSGLTNREALSGAAEGESSLRGYFVAPLVTGIKTYLAQSIRDLKINILEIDTYLESLSEGLKKRLTPRFEEYGLTIPEFYVMGVDLPSEDPNFKEIVSLISEAWLGVRRAEVGTKVAEAKRAQEEEVLKTGLVRAQYQGDIKRAQAKADADIKLMDGMAEAQIMAAQGYNRKDEIAADVQKSFAASLGNMGAGGDLSGGGFNPMGMMAGMAIGSAYGQNMAGMMNGMMSGATAYAPGVVPPPITPIAYHVQMNGQAAGPFDISILQQFVQCGVLTNESMVWKQGMAAWAMAGTVPELQSLFTPNTSSVPGSMPPPF